MSDKSIKFVQDLRRLANLYEQHPELELPYIGNLYAFPETREEVAEVAKELAYLKPKKLFHEDWFSLSIPFETFELHFSIGREKVCERVQVGTKKVEMPEEPAKPARTVEVPEYEWRCSEPILQ